MPNFISKGIGALSFLLLSLCTVSKMEAQELSLHSSIQTELTYSSNSASKVVQQQNKFTVKGTVLDENNTPLAGASVVLKGTSEGVQTDFDGKFEFTRALNEGDVLVFSYLGYDKKEYVVSNSEVANLTITITFEASDIELMGAVVVDETYSSKRSIFRKIGDLFR